MENTLKIDYGEECMNGRRVRGILRVGSKDGKSDVNPKI